MLKPADKKYFEKFLNDYYEQFNYLKDSSNMAQEGSYDELRHVFLKFETELNNLRSKITKDEIKEYHEELKKHPILDILLESPFIKKCYKKFFGYAGDYSTMLDIYRSSDLGDTPFQTYMHSISLNIQAAKAMESRMHVIHKHLAKVSEDNNGKAIVLNLGCGPAWEVKLFFEIYPNFNNSSFVCIDQDPNAINYAKLLLKDKNVRFIKTKLDRFFDNKMKNFDMIYSTGLFDYIPKDRAIQAVNALYSMLNENGRIVIGNMNPKSITKGFLEIVADWQIIYRTDEELLELASQIDAKPAIEYDKTGSNSFLVIKK